VDKVIHYEKNDCIQEVFTGTPEWQRILNYRQELPERYDEHLGEVQPNDGLSPHPNMVRICFGANFPPLLDGRLYGLDSEGELTICWQAMRLLSEKILGVAYDINPAVANILFGNSIMSTNLVVISGKSDLLTNSATSPIYHRIQRETEPIMAQLALKMPSLFANLESIITFGKKPFDTRQRMMEEHSELRSSGMYHQEDRLIHMTPIACGWATIVDVLSLANELSYAFSICLDVPYREISETECKLMYDDTKSSALRSISQRKVRSLLAKTITEMEVFEPEVALHLQLVTQSAFAEQYISNLSRNQAIAFKLSLKHAINNNMTHTIAERQCNTCNREKICAYNSQCNAALDNNRLCSGRCRDQVIRETEEPYNVLSIQSELMFGMCTEANCGCVGLQRSQCAKRDGYYNNPISLPELQARTIVPAGSVTNTTTQYCMTSVPSVMVDNNNVRIDEQVFYHQADAAKRVMEIKANPTILGLGGLSSIPRVLNNKNKSILNDRISILLWNNGSYDGEINFGNFRLRGLGIGKHRDPNQGSTGCIPQSSGRPADIITRYQEEQMEDESEEEEEDESEDELEDQSEGVEQWVQCSTCGKWRKLPASIAAESLPDKWYCANNTWDTQFATCDAIEESDD